VVTGFAFVLALAGCAQPGQLGHPAPAPETAPAAPDTAAAAPAGSQTVGRGVVDVPLRFRTPVPADYVVRTLDLAPGAALGWETHPGTELTLLAAGQAAVTVPLGEPGSDSVTDISSPEPRATGSTGTTAP